MAALGLFFVFILSGALFLMLYIKPTYALWRYKTNAKYPSPGKVRDEIVMMVKGMMAATICPALSIWLSKHGLSQAYCGIGEYGWRYTIATGIIAWIASDLFEFMYHRLGHVHKFFWHLHQVHHKFYNPSPFSVIADEYFDQFARALPLLLFPLVMPVNMDMLFLMYGVFFYGYGVYLHCGYELPWLDAHHPFINTSFQHYCHHAKSVIHKPYHTGFFFKIWDQLAGSMYDKECFCCKCEQKKGRRTKKQFEKVVVPDYTALFKPKFWLKSSMWQIM